MHTFEHILSKTRSTSSSSFSEKAGKEEMIFFSALISSMVLLGLKTRLIIAWKKQANHQN